MAANNGSSSCSFILLQPELMSDDTLIEILVSRGVSNETVQGMTREMLIGLYRKVALPLPQRECRRSATSTEAEQRQLVTPPDDTKKTGFTIGFNYSVQTSIDVSSCRRRTSTESGLEPPPDVQNSSKKIRLSSLDNIAINNRRECQDSEQNSLKVVKKEVSDKQMTDKNGCCSKETSVKGEKEVLGTPKITLKRNFNVQGSRTDQTDDGPQEKKQRAKITWPYCATSRDD